MGNRALGKEQLNAKVAVAQIRDSGLDEALAAVRKMMVEMRANMARVMTSDATLQVALKGARMHGHDAVSAIEGLQMCLQQAAARMIEQYPEVDDVED